MATIASTTPDCQQQRPIPWYIWCAALAVTSAMIGGHWDISWHMSIGRDTFWTPAHMAIYLCGVLSGLAFGYVILSTTFVKTSPLRNASVSIWGFRAPLGAFIASWGGIAMLTSAPFDDWWHSAYGLDVKIVSPPHILLFIGLFAVQFGTLVLIAGFTNRVSGLVQRHARLLFLYVTSIILIMFMVILEEYTGRPLLHTSIPYRAMALLIPFVLALASRSTGIRFAATFVAGVYTAAIIGFVWILPLFPAEPKLGPVYQNVTHFVPPQFPILIIVPALALDLLWSGMKNWNLWTVAAISSVVFVAVLLCAEWPFASFLMSPAARNRVFGTTYLYYALPPTSNMARYLFYSRETLAGLLEGLLIGVAVGIVSFRFGFSRGDAMRAIKR